jgi:hypothetical protein
MRTFDVLPLASAFMLFYLIRIFRKKAAMVVACLTLLVAAYQAQTTAQLFYSDQMRYNDDVHLAYELNNMILKAQPEGSMLPVAFIGRYQAFSRFKTNFLQGDIIGSSSFGVKTSSPVFTTNFGLNFMKSLGIHFDMPNTAQMEQAYNAAFFMPSYPDPGCVGLLDGVIVVRLSDTWYD